MAAISIYGSGEPGKDYGVQPPNTKAVKRVASGQPGWGACQVTALQKAGTAKKTLLDSATFGDDDFRL